MTEEPGTAARSEASRYKAPQHPTSHILHSIPPRAPARSSRSNILSFTLYLATLSRLSTYSTPVGTGALLHRAEAHDPLADRGDDEWFEQEEKSVGLRKLSVSLLAASRREGPLPLMVDRRVALAALTEELLVSPLPAVAPTAPVTMVPRDSARVESLIALAPLTSPDQTTLFYDPAVAAARATSSIAQSLIDMKFSGSVDIEKSSTAGRESESVFGATAGPSSSRNKLTAAPHMDYRIVRGQAMKSRAKEIFGVSILPSEQTAWCRRHRVDACTVCSTKVTEKKLEGKTKRRNVPGQGLNGSNSKRPLAELIPAFLVFSATLLKDLQERASLSDESDMQYINLASTADDSTVDATASWYSLLHSLAIQACLEGYLVDGWTGTEGIEILFGCGCGVWEGKGWASRVAQSAADPSYTGKHKARMDLDGEDSESDSDEDLELEDERMREREKVLLIDAAQCLFGARDEAQAEFERTMRDRTHEFLNVAEDGTLSQHLRDLNAKYPLSAFEREMVDFLECASKQLGKPSLAKYETPVVPAGQLPPSNDPDPYALTRYYARSTEAAPELPARAPHRAWEESSNVKRRKVQ